MATRLEHVNICVKDPEATARVLARLFDWRIRWQGATPDKGTSVHVGNDAGYVALYCPGHEIRGEAQKYRTWGGLNHIAVVVSNLAAMEAAVRAEGFAVHSHADYEPGRRFYFDGPDGVEYEVVAYN